MKKWREETKVNQLELAYAEWRGRQNGSRRPEGAGWKWNPSVKERQDCCDKIREPSARYPLSLLSHCKSAKHVANLFSVEKKDLLRMHKKMSGDYEPKGIVSPKKDGGEWGWF